jgi:UDP-N-acetylglucosamine--N-acetylmuramyl-(pentapeptide) pyrophosphoryl-undecaprenol N-acetylglucosamine transferase
MNPFASKELFVAIACGGTGGHLFPGVAVGGALVARGCNVALLVSPKDVDQQAVRGLTGMDIITLPAVASTAGKLAFLRGFVGSYRRARKLFAQRPPAAVIGMGGFTSAPPLLAGKRARAATFLHESNTIPGRANRWLARFVSRAFVYFPDAAERLNCRAVETVGMPVRPQFAPGDAAVARLALGLDPARPTLLVTGGSQGARGVNELVTRSLPAIAAAFPELQFIHLTGHDGFETVNAAYAAAKLRAIVRPFLADMHLAMIAADAAISRSGASSLAETAAMRLPSILVPYPIAADDHQRHNALAFVNTGAALLLEQRDASPEKLLSLLQRVFNPAEKASLQNVMAHWHQPEAAAVIADKVLAAIGATHRVAPRVAAPEAAPDRRHLKLATPEVAPAST